MLGHVAIEPQAAEPTICQIKVNLFAEPPLGADAEAVADQQHPDHQLGSDGGASDRAVKPRQLPELVRRRGLVLELIGGLHHHEGGAGDQAMRLEQTIDRCFRDKIAFCVGDAALRRGFRAPPRCSTEPLGLKYHRDSPHCRMNHRAQTNRTGPMVDGSESRKPPCRPDTAAASQRTPAPRVASIGGG
jgi:hypothetical protein